MSVADRINPSMIFDHGRSRQSTEDNDISPVLAALRFDGAYSSLVMADEGVAILSSPWRRATVVAWCSAEFGRVA